MEEENPIDLVEFLKDKSSIPIASNTKLPNYNIEGASGYGDSKYDTQFYPDAQLNKDGTGLDLVSFINEQRSNKQPSLIKAGAGLLRAGSKALQEIAKMPGVIGGIVGGGVGQLNDAITGKDETDFIKTAFDNKWVQTINEIGETINTEALPVYVSKSVTEGNLWDNISSIDFWATEGADGLGYIISMLAPGAAINKLGVGSKLIKTLNKTTNFKDSTIRAAEKLAELGLPTNAKNIDLYSQTLANTLFEAGAEAQGAMESYKISLDNKLQNGEISQEEYDIQLAKQSEIGRNVFTTNAAILIGPNAIMSKMLWGKARNKIAGKIVNEEGVLSKIKNPSFLRKVKLYGDDFGKATLREGFFEEGLQSTAETYFTENPDKGILDMIGDLPKAYADMVLSTEGQKAILLGGVFGGGMQAYTGGKSRSNERKTTNNLIDLGNSALTDMYNVFNEDVYEKDENGEIIYENDKPKVNYKKVQDKLKSQDSLESLSALYDVAIENNDTQTIEQIKDLVSTNLVKPFIVNDELGIDVLKQHLELSKDIEAISEREKKDKRDYINNIVQKAENLQTDYNSFQDYANDLINLKNGTDSQKVDFYNKLSMQYLDSKARQYYLTDKLKETENKYNELIRSKGVDLSLVEDNARLQRDLNQDSRIRKTTEDIKNLKSSLESAKKVNDSFWDGTSIQKAYDAELKETVSVNENVEKNADKADNDISTIKTAKTKEDINSVDSKNPIVEAEKEKKLQEIDNTLAAERETTKENNKEFENQNNIAKNEVNEDFDYIANNFNEEEIIALPDSLGGGTAIINQINPTNIIVEDSNGELRTITKNQFNDNNPALDYNVEGSDTPTIQDEDTNQKDNPFDKRNEAKIITVDKDGNKLSFVDQAAVDFERTPRNKVGDSVGFQINPDVGLSEKQIKARSMILEKDFSDKIFLINHLPINVKLTDDVLAPIETLSEVSNKYNDIFAKTTKRLRKAIVEELANGNNIENITSEIAGQWNGELQLEEEVLENNIADLYEFAGDIKKVKSDNLYVVNDKGFLFNTKGDQITTKNNLAPGEIYLKIHMANGKEFPLKLNIKRVSIPQAELLYELYKYRFEDINEGKSTKIVDTNDAVLDSVKEVFAEEIKLFEKNKRPLSDLTIKDVVDFIIWDGSKSPKSQVRFLKGKLLVANESYTAEDFNKESAKEDFIYTLTTQKRNNIKFKRRPGEGFESLNFQNRDYIEYLINNNILNTNAKVNEPTFAGITNMYLAPDKVKVNGKLSKFNTIFKTKEVKPNVVSQVSMGNKLDYAKLGLPVPENVKKNETPVSDNPISKAGLAKLGLAIEPTPKATPEPKRVEAKKTNVEEQTINSFRQPNNLLATGEPLTFDKQDYVMTKDYYVVNITTKRPVTDIPTILKYVDAYNSVTNMKSWKLNKNNIEKIWNSRLNVVPLQDNIKKEEMTETDITESLKSLMLAYPTYTKDLMLIADKNKNKSMSDILQAVITFLKSKNISEKEIQTKCK